MAVVAVLDAGVPSGPLQLGRAVHGQYVYWVTQNHPSDGNPHQLRPPSEFTDRKASCDFMVKAHNDFFKQGRVDNESSRPLRSKGRTPTACRITTSRGASKHPPDPRIYIHFPRDF